MTPPNHERNLLLEIGTLLRTEYVSGTDWLIPETLVPLLALLDDLALRSNRVYSIFDFSRFDYLYCSPNLATLAGDDRSAPSVGSAWDETYFTIIQDRKRIAEFLEIRRHLSRRLRHVSFSSLESSVCGGAITNLKGQRLRLHYRSTPLVLDEAGNVALSFDFLEDVTPLLTASTGYWMRFAGQQVFHWRSDTRRLVAKDIVSPREKALISLWKAGKSIAEIADQACINTQTVKNQLSNARNRLFARDNTALSQLCTVVGALPPAF